MLERISRKCSGIIFVLFLEYTIALDEINHLLHYRAIKSPDPRIAHSILRDVNKPQFEGLRSDGTAHPESGFDLSDDEIKKMKLWDKGVIPFYIDNLSFSDKVLRDRIRWFLNEVNSLTSLNFLELPTPPEDNTTRWLFFINRQAQLDCADLSMSNFTIKGVQRVVLGYDCLNAGAGLAGIVLAIAGVLPQHNAPDRDHYIRIVNENIMPEKEYLFDKLRNDQWLFHDLQYDYLSAGHYHNHEHSANGRATIRTKKPGIGITIGDQRGFSSTDIVKIKLLYNYIVKKNNNKLPACAKLFKRGKNFNKVPVDSEENMKPIPKPKKYLGIEDDDDKGNDKINNGSVLDGSDEKGSNNDESYEGKNDKDDTEDTDLESDRFQKAAPNKTPDKTTLKLKLYRDPLSYLSDYQTGDESLKRSVWKKSRLL